MKHRITPFALAVVIASSLGHAQERTGSITGTVINQVTREPLPSANVQIPGTSLGASTDKEGRFDIPNVPVGTYTVRASLIGYGALIISDVVVAVGKHVDLLFKMTEEAVELTAVETKARYFGKDPDAQVSVQQLSYEEIRRSPGGFEDVLRAIAVLPGVAQPQPGRNDLVVRGGAPSENLYVVDNVSIPNINHFGTQGASGGPLCYINLDFVRETSFSTGGFGVRYGDRMSSTLTIDLADGREDRLGGKATVAATQFGLNLQGPVGADGTFIFSARRSYLDLIFKAARFSFVPEYWDFLGRMTYKIDQTNDLTILAVGAIDDVTFFNDDAEARYKNSRILGTAQQQYAAGFSWRHLVEKGYTTVTLGRSFVRYDGIQRDSLLNPIFTDQSKEVETSLRADMVMQADRSTEVSFGLEGKIVNFDTQIGLPFFVTPFGDTLAVQAADYASRPFKGAAYVQLAHRFIPRLLAVVGLRADYFSEIGHSWYFSPRASLTYEFSDITSVSLSAGVYHQNPSYVWLVAQADNRNLRAAEADQYIAGIEHMLDVDLKVRLEAFRKRYTDYPASVERPYLVLANTGGGFGGSEDNFASYGLDHLVSGGNGLSQGVEFLIQKKLSDTPYYGLMSLTVGQAQFTALDGIQRPGTFDQTVIVNITGGYRFDEEWEGSMKFRYATGRPYTPFNADGTQDVAIYNAARADAWHSLDLRVDRRWNFSAWNLVVYVDVQNVFNNKYTGTVRWNAREGKVETNEEGIGILPSVGISAEL